jgi:diguanylate cyclase (GGDEF)-like protein
MGIEQEDPLYDTLTGLPGPLLQRAHLVHALKRAVRDGSQVAVLFLDVEDFGDINRRIGRELGDQVLVVIAARLRACLRGTDLTARLDGDQFSIVCEDLIDGHGLDIVSRRIRDALAVPLHVGGTTIEIRATIGAAMSSGADRPGDLLAAADSAMGAHRRSRRGRPAV